MGKKLEEKWKQRLKELKSYKKKHGDCLVPKRYEQDHKKLGVWVSTQRREYKKWLKGVHSKITQERIDQLNEIDFVWEVGKHQPDDTLWKKRFNELKAYKKKHGDCIVPAKYEHNEKLGTWVHNQRTQYKNWLKGLKTSITQERIDELNEIDFVWEVGGGGRKDEKVWKQQFNKLVKYKKKHGDCLVPAKYEHNAKLGNWVDTQRQQYKKWLNGENSPITQERIDQLNEIGFVWEGERYRFPKDDTVWKQHFNELVKYKKKQGDCLVPQNYEHNKKLGLWVAHQRQFYKKWLNGESTCITQERIDHLNEIDFVWEVQRYKFPKDDTLWKQRLKELKSYKKKHGDCRVPYIYKQNKQLGIWVSVQRVQYKKWLNEESTCITQERIDQLNEIDFVWEVGKHFQRDDTLWKQRFNELVKYKKSHGDCFVPYNYKDNAKLRTWVAKQRVQYKKWLNGLHSSITQERIDQLNEIDFVWEGKRGRKSKESNKSNQEGPIPTFDHRNVASVTNQSKRPRKRQEPSKDRPRKRQRRRQSQDVGRELSPNERKKRRRFMLQALYNWRNPMQPDEVISS